MQGPLRGILFSIINLRLSDLIFLRLQSFSEAVDVLVSGLLLSVEASAETVLVAGCGLHHAGANCHLHLPV